MTLLLPMDSSNWPKIPVKSLLGVVRPTAIFFEVSKIIIYPVEGMPFWARPHVFVKCFKTLPPPIIGYPFFTVVFRVFKIRIITSSFHIAPDRILPSVPHSVAYALVIFIPLWYILQISA